MRKTVPLVAFGVVLTVVLTLGEAWGQQADTFKVDYFDNANTTGAPDGRVRLTNPGTTKGNICASIFVFDSDDEMMECCSCQLVPNGLRKLSVNHDLTGNPLNGVPLTTGSIEIVSSTPVSGACPAPTKITAMPALRAWSTHIQDVSFAVTETASQEATLNTDELDFLEAGCYAIEMSTGGGSCTCGTGD
jgi:hypothetical protein